MLPGGVNQIGTQAVITGMGTFVNNANTFNRTIVRMTQVVQQTPQAAGPASSALNFLGSAVSNVGSVIAGILGAGLIRKFFTELRQGGAEILESLSNFQKLRVQIEGLIARELRASDSTISVAESFTQATAKTKEFISWVQQLALLSPVTVESAFRVSQLAYSYQFTTSQVKTLTEAVMNFVAGMGLGDEEAVRIIQNFGQMRFAGKVLGTELRDLARGAFVPVLDLIQRMADKAGVPFEVMKEAATSGKVSVDAFFESFVEMVREDMPNAAKRMLNTWQGITNTIGDFIKVVMGVDLLGPIFDRFVTNVSTRLQQLVTPETRNQFERFGEFLNDFFGPLIDNMFQWGDSMMQSLAAGMINGLFAVLDALIQLANLITSLLQAHSPPKLLPYLPEWGKSAVEAYMSGWRVIDFKSFDTIKDTIVSFLKSLPEEVMPKVDLIPKIFGTRFSLAAIQEQFRQTGDVGQEALDQLSEAMGFSDDTIQKFIVSMYEWTEVEELAKKATDRLDRAQDAANAKIEELDQIIESTFSDTSDLSRSVQSYREALVSLTAAQNSTAHAQEWLNWVTRAYDEMLAPIDRELAQISDAQETLQESMEMGEIEWALKNPFISEEEKSQLLLRKREIELQRQRRQIQMNAEAATQAAQSELQAAQSREDAAQRVADQRRQHMVDLAQAEADAAQLVADAAEETYLQLKNLIEQRIEENNLLREQIALLEALKEKAKSGGAGAGEPLTVPFDWPTPETPDVEAMVSDFVDRLRAKMFELAYAVGSMWNEIKTQWAPLFDALDDLKTKFGELVDEVKKDGPEIQGLMSVALAGLVVIIGTWGPLIIQQWTGILESIRGLWADWGPAVIALAVWAFLGIVQSSLMGFYLLSAAVNVGMQLIQGIMHSAWLAIQGDWDKAKANLHDTIENFFLGIVKVSKTFLDTMLRQFGTSYDEIYALLLINIFAMTVDLTSWYTGVMNKVNRFLLNIGDLTAKFIQAGADLAAGLLEGVSDGLSGLGAWLTEKVMDAVDYMLEQLGIHSPSLFMAKEVGKPLAQGIAVGITKALPEIRKALVQATTVPLNPGPAATATATRYYTYQMSRIYQLNVTSTQPSQGIQNDFYAMEAAG